MKYLCVKWEYMPFFNQAHSHTHTGADRQGNIVNMPWIIIWGDLLLIVLRCSRANCIAQNNASRGPCESINFYARKVFIWVRNELAIAIRRCKSPKYGLMSTMSQCSRSHQKSTYVPYITLSCGNKWFDFRWEFISFCCNFHHFRLERVRACAQCFHAQ